MIKFIRSVLIENQQKLNVIQSSIFSNDVTENIITFSRSINSHGAAANLFQLVGTQIRFPLINGDLDRRRDAVALRD